LPAAAFLQIELRDLPRQPAMETLDRDQIEIVPARETPG
jgi:hypothetical protein